MKNNRIAAALWQAKKFIETEHYARLVVEETNRESESLINLAKCCNVLGKFDEAEQLILEAVRTGTENRLYYLDLQVTLGYLRRFEEAEQIGKKLIKDFPGDPKVIFNNAWHKIRTAKEESEYFAGLKDLEAGRSIGCFGSSAVLDLLKDKPRYDFTNEWLQGDVIAIVGEGGLGDEIIASRYAVLLDKVRKAYPIIICHQSLKKMFQRIHGVYKVFSHEEFTAKNAEEIDYWIPGMAIPGEYGFIPTKPWIQTDLETDSKYWLRKEPKLNVGIRWAGNQQFEHDQMRTIPVQLFQPIVDLDRVNVYSLQKDEARFDLPKNSRIKDMSQKLETWDDTASIMDQMDIIVTSCTSIAHLAGALGIKTFVIPPILSYYPWANDLFKWYNTVTVVRTEIPNDFSGPMNKVYQIIKNLTGENNDESY